MNEDKKQKAKSELMFFALPYIEIKAVICMLSVIIGLLLDILFGTVPYFLLIFPLLGMVAIIIIVIFFAKKKMKYLSKNDPQLEKRK